MGFRGFAIIFILPLLSCEEDPLSFLPQDDVESLQRSEEPIIRPSIERWNQQSKPNFIVVIIDDLRYDALGIIQERLSGKGRFPSIKTPHLDAMTRNGILFSNAFVTTSLCSPSRASILTGLYARHHGIKNNHTPFDRQSFASTLKDNGYHTAYFGKWHMGEQAGRRPGFRHSFSFLGQGMYIDPEFEDDGEPTESKGWVDRISTDKLLTHLETQVVDQQLEEPFCAVLGFKSCHGPWDAAPPDTRQLYPDYETKWVPNMDRVPPYPTFHLDFERYVAEFTAQDRGYFQYLWVADQQMGRIQQFLKEHDLLDSTYVIFISDNGYYMGEHQQIDKRSAYEESMRIPLIIQGPGVARGIIVDEFVLNVDIAPTILGLAGFEGEAMDGRDLQPLFDGQEPVWRPSIFYEYFSELIGPQTNIRAYRTDRYKLIKYSADPTWTEFFNLTNDPFETQNLYGAAEYETIQVHMEEDIDRWIQEQP